MKRFIDFTKKEEELEVVRESFIDSPVEKEPEIIKETVREVIEQVPIVGPMGPQ